MKKIFYIVVFLLLAFESFAAGNVIHIQLKWNASKFAKNGYSGTIYKISKKGRKSVHQFEVLGNSYHWETNNNDGFFILKVYPLNANGKATRKGKSLKSFFLEKTPKKSQVMSKKLCRSDYTFKWRKGTEKGKFLVHLKNIEDKSVLINKITLKNSIKVDSDTIDQNQVYHLNIVLRKKRGGPISVANRYYTFRNCNKAYGKVKNKKLKTSIYWTPKLSILSQSSSNGASITSTKKVIASFGADALYKLFKKNSIFAKIEYNKFTGDTEVRDQESELVFLWNYDYSREFSVLGGIEYINFEDLNLEVIENDSSAYAQDAHTVIFLSAGGSMRFTPFKLPLLVKGLIGYSTYSKTAFGNSDVQRNSTYSGLAYSLSGDLDWKYNLVFKVGVKGKMLSGPSYYSQLDSFFGAGYRF